MYVVLEQGGEEEERASVDNYKTGGRDQQQGREQARAENMRARAGRCRGPYRRLIC